MSLEITRKKHDQATILCLKGRIDANTSEQLQKVLKEDLNNKVMPLLLDFTDVHYLSSAGLRVLLEATKEYHKQTSGKYLALLGLQAHVKEIICIAGFHKVFCLYSTQAEALGNQ